MTATWHHVAGHVRNFARVPEPVIRVDNGVFAAVEAGLLVAQEGPTHLVALLLIQDGWAPFDSSLLSPPAQFDLMESNIGELEVLLRWLDGAARVRTADGAVRAFQGTGQNRRRVAGAIDAMREVQCRSAVGYDYWCMAPEPGPSAAIARLIVPKAEIEALPAATNG
jgi:hypothetical protein